MKNPFARGGHAIKGASLTVALNPHQQDLIKVMAKAAHRTKSEYVRFLLAEAYNDAPHDTTCGIDYMRGGINCTCWKEHP